MKGRPMSLRTPIQSLVANAARQRDTAERRRWLVNGGIDDSQ